MGGKDSIIVDANCDLDSALDGVVASAFGFSGQKCSACSRAIVDAAIYDDFLEKLVERVEAIKQGDPAKNFYGGPVISPIAFPARARLHQGRRIRSPPHDWRRQSRARRRLLHRPHRLRRRQAPNDARIALEEIFGPVLAVIKSHSFDEALAIANNTEYGLTGAIYTHSEDKLNRAREEFHVGNLYLNRKCTGAMVGAHPFGGFNMSGTDSKAGGPDYLLLFTQGKSIAEKVSHVDKQADLKEAGPGI